MKNIKGDLILTKDTTFNEDLKVEGNIKGYYNLKAGGGDINCWDIHCLNIDCLNIDCRNIILCNKIRVKEKCISKALIKDRYNIKRKEQLKEKN